MTPCSTRRETVRHPRWLALLAWPLLASAVACDDGSQRANVSSNGATTPEGPMPTGFVKVSPPQITAGVSKGFANWADGQQTFTLSVTNDGKKAETFHAIVYARNEDINPPRRAISPPTAYDWFRIAGSSDGKLTAKDIERNWKKNSFVSARGGKLPFSWTATIDAGATQTFEASHVLDEMSPHAASKGKRLAKKGFTEYQIWLFTADGYCFDEKTVSANGTAVVERPPTGKTTAKEPPEPKPEDAEEQAQKLLKLANYYIDTNQTSRAKEKLQLILDKFPQTAAAKLAKKLLKEI